LLDQLRLLVKLQILDKTLFDLGQDKETIPGRLADINRVEETLQTKLDKNQAQLDEVLAVRRGLDESGDSIRSRLRKTENRLMGAKTTREYQAANAEIDDNKDMLRDNEDQLLEVMERQEGLEAVVGKLSQKLEKVSAESKEERETLEKRYHDTETEINRLDKKRNKIVGAVDPSLLGEYDFIRQRRDGLALSPVTAGTCGVCHMGIPPQQYNELQRMDKIMHCPSCRRLIYWADAEEFADAK
jgi:uncharacterized protein